MTTASRATTAKRPCKTDTTRKNASYIAGALRCILEGHQPKALVLGDVGMWYEEPANAGSAPQAAQPGTGGGQSGKSTPDGTTEEPSCRVIAPDVLVALEAADDPTQTSYRVDQGEPAPTLVVEILSTGTAQRDLGRKRDVYRALGVREIWTIDLRYRHVPDGLAGLVLRSGEYS